MISAVEVARLLDGRDVSGFLDYAHKALIPRGAAAIDAGINVSNVIADGAQPQVGLHVAHRCGESLGVGVAGAQNMKRQTLRALAADPRQLLEFVDEPRHGLGKFRHFPDLVI
jgi:hypothetical protein